MRFYFGLLCVWVTVVSATPVEFDAHGIDRSAAYQKIIENLHEHSFEEFREYKFLLIPGFLSDQFMELETWPIANKFARSFDDQKIWLTDQKIEFDFLKTRSQDAPAINVPLLRKFIDASSKPVIFISHSRGGLDVLETLLSLGVGNLSKIKGWVSLQTPFQGTPMADEVLKDDRLKNIVAKALRKTGGSIDSVISLSTPNRKTFLSERGEEIAKVLASVPTISFSSWKPNLRWKIDTTYEIQRNFLEYRGYQTDGLVPWQSEIIPGHDFVFQNGIDHPSTVNKGFLVPFDRIKMTQALLILLNTQMRARI